MLSWAGREAEYSHCSLSPMSARGWAGAIEMGRSVLGMVRPGSDYLVGPSCLADMSIHDVSLERPSFGKAVLLRDRRVLLIGGSDKPASAETYWP